MGKQEDVQLLKNVLNDLTKYEGELNQSSLCKEISFTNFKGLNKKKIEDIIVGASADLIAEESKVARDEIDKTIKEIKRKIILLNAEIESEKQ